MVAVAKQGMTPDEYLAFEREAECKHEYLAGQIYAMAGATEAHNLIAANVISELRFQLKGKPCKTYPSDMRVKVSTTGLYTYPDVIVVCGEARFDGNRKDTLLNPTVIIEVLSPSTAADDRGSKFAHYRRLESVQDYILIAQDRVYVEQFTRQPNNRWLLSEASDLQGAIRLDSIGCDLRFVEVYDKVEFPPEAQSRAVPGETESQPPRLDHE